jgi:hypothetical protein
MKLNPDDLDIMSFETESTERDAEILPTSPNQPTPATFCRICPVGDSYDICTA